MEVYSAKKSFDQALRLEKENIIVTTAADGSLMCSS
jgi:hypothetical protein